MTSPRQGGRRERGMAGRVQSFGAEVFVSVLEHDATGWHRCPRRSSYNSGGESNTLIVIGRIERRSHRAGGGIFVHRLRKRGRAARAEASAAVVGRSNGM